MPNYRYQTPDTMCRTRNVCKESCMEQRMPGRDICDGPIAMAYVPWQKWQALYEAEKGSAVERSSQSLTNHLKEQEGGCDDGEQVIKKRVVGLDQCGEFCSR